MTRRKTRAAEQRNAAPFTERFFLQYSMRPPSGWKDMCKAAGLRPVGSRADKRQILSWCDLKGHGRRWRLSLDNKFDVGSRYADFDRWANSRICSHPLPVNKYHLRLLTTFTDYDT